MCVCQVVCGRDVLLTDGTIGLIEVEFNVSTGFVCGGHILLFFILVVLVMMVCGSVCGCEVWR